ncbi:MAG: prevent-host-death protein [Hyphomicrobiales bacterium]|nr:MAG: prevent-host-death protein [Hyphomicrobiales bacterium]
MAKTPAVPAAEFTRNFGRYRMLAQRGAVPVTSHGQITGYFVPPDEYQEFERFRAQRRSFATVDLSGDKVRQIAETRMDARHDHLNALLDPK